MPIIDPYVFYRRALWNTKRSIFAFDLVSFASTILFSLCTASFYLILNPIEVKTAALRHEVSLLGTPGKAKFSSKQYTQNPAEQLAAFYHFFPKEGTVSDWMAKLYGAATQQKLTLENGEYRLAHNQNGRLSRYDIVLPVKGSYLQIRKFIAQALVDIPSLALDGISFNRQKVDDAYVDAQIRFTLYLRAE